MSRNSEKDSFTARLDDMCALAAKRGCAVYSAFLNEREQFTAQRFIRGISGIKSVLWGGHEACVRKMLAVIPEYGYENEGYDDLPIFTVSISYREADKPEHKDLLGSIMALGIERETVGDIFAGNTDAAVFCTKTAHDVILGGIEKIGRVGVTTSDGLSEKALAAVIPAGFRDVIVNIASMRCDCVVGGITGLSREKSAAYVRSGSFLLNYEECTDVSRNAVRGDVLTLRGYGKYIVDGDVSFTKKGRIRLELKKYI